MILIIDDDFSITASLSLLLKQTGYDCITAANPEQAITALRENQISIVLQDINFSRSTSGEEGLALLDQIKQLAPQVPVLLITAWGSIELAVKGLKAGAADFITKPWSNEQIIQSVRTALGLAASQLSSPPGEKPTRSKLDQRFDFSGICGEDPRFLEVLELIGRVGGTDASILITGDSGTGKEVIAEAIHRNSPRREKPFVKVNLGGISTTLFESEMFGHVRGAFTDALRDRQGRFAMAEGGTILLDEIGDLDLRCQVKLLRVLQDRTYESLGSSKTQMLDVRVIAATNHDLPAAVHSGEFREDLYYRINLISINLPTLVERLDDIPNLANHFIVNACATYHLPAATLDPSALNWLRGQSWPGNIRQLKHLIERALLVSEKDLLTARDFELVRQNETRAPSESSIPAVGQMSISEVEKAMIEKSLRHHGGNLSRVAESLGLSRAALYRRLEKYGIKT